MSAQCQQYQVCVWSSDWFRQRFNQMTASNRFVHVEYLEGRIFGLEYFCHDSHVFFDVVLVSFRFAVPEINIRHAWARTATLPHQKAAASSRLKSSCGGSCSAGTRCNRSEAITRYQSSSQIRLTFLVSDRFSFIVFSIRRSKAIASG